MARALAVFGACLLGACLLAACRSSGAASTALPQLGTVGPFWLTDQEGRSFSEQSLTGKVWVAAFMFTRCPTICPEMMRRMRYLQEQAKARELALSFVSFSVDPDNDTPAVLRRFAAEYGVDTRSWSFLTGDNSVIRNAAEQGFKIGVEGSARPGTQSPVTSSPVTSSPVTSSPVTSSPVTSSPVTSSPGITHGTHLVLLDGARTIRGYYQSSEPAKLAQLLDDAATLLR